MPKLGGKLYQFLLLFLVVLLTFVTLIDYFHLFSVMLTQWQLMEPAENENLVLTWAIANNYATTSDNLLGHGVLPIYPDLYHRLSALMPLGPQFGGRLLSIMAYIGISVAIFLLAKKRTGSWVLGSLFAVVLFGHSTHAVYFLMQRADAMYIALGTASLLIIWWNLNVDENINDRLMQMSYWQFLLAGGVLGLALLSKQTAILFALLHTVPFIANWVVRRRLVGLLKLGVIAGASVATIILYILMVNNAVIDDYLFGMSLFGNASWSIYDALNKYEVDIFYADHYSYFVFACIAAVFMQLKIKNISHLLFVFGVGFLVVLITLKLWTNTAAFFNNFILISVFGVLLVLYLWPKEVLVKQAFLVIPLLLFGVLSYAGVGGGLVSSFKQLPSTLYEGSYMRRFSETMVAASSEDKILAYIKANSGQYITTRLDNYLIAGGREVEFEGSVLGMFVIDGVSIANYTKKESTVKAVTLLTKNLHEKIANQYFQGILLGLPIEEFIKNYPELLEYYMPYRSRPITQGNSKFSAVLYVKKNN